MGRRRPRGRPIDGVLLLDKPIGSSSNEALQQVKRMYFARKAGHTGSLDPLASGLLPICFGEATKLSSYLLDADKHYRVRARLGERTDTGDSEGKIVEQTDARPESRETLAAAMQGFVGDIEQIPPMYSALRHKGKRLYELAREGVEVEREPRPIHIYSLHLTDFDADSFGFAVHCSKGTYVRTLAEDIAAAVGSLAHVIELRRTGAGPFDDSELHTMEELEDLRQTHKEAMDDFLLPMDSALGHWPAVNLNGDSSFYFRQGQPVMVPKAPSSGLVRVYDVNEHFIAVGEIQDDGMVAPRRLLTQDN